jgi:hypothetical protein
MEGDVIISRVVFTAECIKPSLRYETGKAVMQHQCHTLLERQKDIKRPSQNFYCLLVAIP